MKEKLTQQQTNGQAARFKDAARELGCDEDESHFEEKLRKVARHKPPPSADNTTTADKQNASEKKNR